MYNDPIAAIELWISSHFFGKYRGTVVANDGDDAKCGRLKVRVPAVLGTVEVWAMPCVPYAGEKVGFYCLPEPQAGVWVEFEGGDPSYPVWTGCFWASDELPPDAKSPAIKILQTRKAYVEIDADEGTIVATNEKKAKLTVGDDVKSEAGEATHTVGSKGVVSEQGSGKVEVTTSAVKINNDAMQVM
ncbi:MAG: phage baseplate assembly protein V [Burkholderiales bacterium]